MKLKAFLEKLKKDTGATLPEFDTVIAAAPDFEVDDKVVAEYDSKLYTVDRALNDSIIAGQLQTKARTEVWDKIDSLVEPFLPLLDEETAKEVKGSKKTYDRIEKLQTAVKAQLDKAKAAGKDSPQELKDLQKKLSTVEEEYNRKLNDQESQWKQKYESQEKNLKNVNLDFILKNKIFKHQFAKEFESRRETIANLLIADWKRQHLLSSKDDGDVLVQYDDNGTVRDRFDGSNQKMTIDSLIQKDLEPYVKKNNAGDDNPGGKTKSTFSDTRNDAAPTDTSADRRRANRSNNMTTVK